MNDHTISNSTSSTNLQDQVVLTSGQHYFTITNDSLDDGSIKGIKQGDVVTIENMPTQIGDFVMAICDGVYTVKKLLEDYCGEFQIIGKVTSSSRSYIS